jgi:hypothetical protein
MGRTRRKGKPYHAKSYAAGLHKALGKGCHSGHKWICKMGWCWGPVATLVDNPTTWSRRLKTSG